MGELSIHQIPSIVYFSWACGIEFDDQLIVTGGYYTLTRVDVYTINGWSSELPQLITGRYHHGCGQYINSDDKMVNCIKGNN